MKCGREKQDQSKPQLIIAETGCHTDTHTHTHTHTLILSLLYLSSIRPPSRFSLCLCWRYPWMCVCVCVFTCVTLCRCFDLIHPRICFTPQQHDKPLFFILSLSFTHCQTALAGVPEPCVNTHLSPILCYESRRNEFRSHR